MALVCSCYGVSDRRIAREIEHGACSIADIGERCRAGTCCQNCHETLDELLAQCTARRPAIRLSIA